MMAAARQTRRARQQQQQGFCTLYGHATAAYELMLILPSAATVFDVRKRLDARATR